MKEPKNKQGTSTMKQSIRKILNSDQNFKLDFIFELLSHSWLSNTAYLDVAQNSLRTNRLFLYMDICVVAFYLKCNVSNSCEKNPCLQIFLCLDSCGTLHCSFLLKYCMFTKKSESFPIAFPGCPIRFLAEVNTKSTEIVEYLVATTWVGIDLVRSKKCGSLADPNVFFFPNHIIAQQILHCPWS